jgi:hypothetical protein
MAKTRVTCPPCKLTGPAQVSEKAAAALGRVHDGLIHRGQPTATTK